MAKKSTTKANIMEINDAKWAINSINGTYGDTTMSVAEVVDFMDAPPRKSVETDAAKRGAKVFESEFGIRVRITGGTRSNPCAKKKQPKRKSKTVTFSDGRCVTFKRSVAKKGAKQGTFLKGRVAAPSGKKHGDTFMKNGKRYMVMRYTSNGHRMSYAQHVRK